MRYLITPFFISTVILCQEIVPGYWNSLSTHVTVGVPLLDDETLIKGRIQLKVSFNDGDSFEELGDEATIQKGDIDDLKLVSVPADIFENMIGFQEGVKAKFIAQVWDRAGNSITSSVSDSMVIVDQLLPELISLEITSSNELDPTMAMPGDSITFQINTNESINKPILKINEDIYEGAVGIDKSWMYVYPSDDADDGVIDFQISYTDIAGNPGVPLTKATDGKTIIRDAIEPELDEVVLFTSNLYDSSLAIEGDTVFLTFNSSEQIRDIKILLNSSEAILKNQGNLSFTYYHVFTQSDSEGVIPLLIDYNDMAGNVGETLDETTNDSEITLDMNPPAEFTVEMVGSMQGEIIEKPVRDKKTSGKNSKEKKQGLGLFSIIIISVICLTMLLVLISWFRIFSKAGQAGWKALVPFFNIFIFTKIAKKPIWWIAIYLVIPVGYILSALQISKLFGKKLIFSIGLIFLPMVFFPLLAFGKAEYFGE